MKRNSFWDYQKKHEDSLLLKQVIALRDEIIEAKGTLEIGIQRLNQWAPTGIFQTKLAYDFFRPKCAKITWPKLVWHSSIIPRQSFILWLGLKDRLLTKHKLQGMVEDPKCPLCRAENEIIDHLFFYLVSFKNISS